MSLHEPRILHFTRWLARERGLSFDPTSLVRRLRGAAADAASADKPVRAEPVSPIVLSLSKEASAGPETSARHFCKPFHSISTNLAGGRKPLPQAASNSAVGLDACTCSSVLPSPTCARTRSATVLSMSR